MMSLPLTVAATSLPWSPPDERLHAASAKRRVAARTAVAICLKTLFTRLFCSLTYSQKMLTLRLRVASGGLNLTLRDIVCYKYSLHVCAAAATVWQRFW